MILKILTLTNLKGIFWHESINQRKTTEEERTDEIYQQTSIAIDFYRRIVPRLEAMMKNAPDYEFICFMGP